MKNTFILGASYNAMQTMAVSALANNCKPIFLTDLEYIGTEIENDEVILHTFNSKKEKQFFNFDDAFINNGKSHDNSMIIVLRNLTVRNTFQ